MDKFGLGWVPSDSFSAPRFSNRVAFVFVRTLGEVGRFPPMSFPPPGEEVEARTATGPHLPIRLLLDDGLVPLLAPGAAITLADASPDAPVTMVSVSSSLKRKCVHEEDLPKILLTRVAGFFFQTFPKFPAEKPRREGRAGGPRPAARREPTLQGGGLRGRGTPKASVRAGHGAVRTKQNVFVSLRVTARRHTTPPNPEVSV